MTSYIKFMFKYLFEPEALSAELLEEAGGGAGGNSSGLFILSPQQQPANYSASLLATDTSSSPASALGDNLLTSLPNSSSSSSQPGGGGSGGLVSLTIINKSSPLSAGNTDRALLAGHGQHHQHQQQQLEWLWLQQQQSAESDGNDAKLWPSKCLNFVRLFAMAQTNNNNNNSPNGTTSTVANGTSSGQLGQLSSSSSSTTSSSSSSSASAYSSSSWPANSLLVRLGSFTEFEHLIRQQLAGLFNGSSSNNNNNNNSHRILRSVATSSTTTPDSSSSSSSSLSSTAFSILNQASRPPQIRADPYQGPAGLTGAGPTTTTSSSGDSATWSSSSLVQDGHSTSTTTNNSGSGRLLRLLIRSIGASQEEEDRGTLLEVSVGPTAAQASGQSRQLREAQAMVSGEQHGSSSSSPATTTSPLPSASWLANWMPAQDPTPAGAESIQQQQQQQQQQQWATETFASSPTASSAELLDCYKQLQLSEYYQGYDIFIGLRIASTLTILFVVFILFVIYKTGCRDGDRVSRSQLRLTSAAGNVKGGAGMASGPARQAANLRDKQQTRRPRRKGKTACRTSPGRNDCGKSGFACSCAHQASCSPSASEPHYPPGQKPWLLLARGDEQIIEATNGGGGCGAASVAGATLTLDQEPPDTGQNKNRPINKSWPTSNTGEPQHWPTAATTAKTTTTTSPSVVITAAHGEPL